MTRKTICLTPLRVVPGSRLARSVVRHDGRLLVAAGVELDRDLLAQLFERGIEFVYVETDDTRDPETIEHDVAVVRDRVDLLFRGPASEARDALRAAITTYRCEGAR